MMMKTDDVEAQKANHAANMKTNNPKVIYK